MSNRKVEARMFDVVAVFVKEPLFNVFRHVVEQFKLDAENWPAKGLVAGPWSFDDHVLRIAKQTWKRVGSAEVNEAFARIGMTNGEPWDRTYDALDGRCEESERPAVASVILALFYAMGETLV